MDKVEWSLLALVPIGNVGEGDRECSVCSVEWSVVGSVVECSVVQCSGECSGV